MTSLTSLVRSLQAHPYLYILRSLGLFDETNIYSIVIEYISVNCTWAPVPSLTTYNEVQNIIDRVGAPVFSSHLLGVRFCFPSIPTFKSLGGAVDVGVTILSAPPPPPPPNAIPTYISIHQSEFFTIERSHTGSYASLLHFSMRTGEGMYSSVTFPLNHRLAYIDLLVGWTDDLSKKKMTIIIAHAQGKRSTNVQLTKHAIEFDRFLDSPLYPVLSCRSPIDVSIHALV